ncbi:MAG TPA: tripartite tricarboxylate transporter substrate binding protein [Opitutaceae bacterium]|nr:tripartite tricarboxylate transporter substrate binding protein [Opitutaceae bacterium]
MTSSAAGGSNDQIARVMQNIIQGGKLTPTPVSVVNKPGGNQTIAPTYLNMQPGDGHYLLLANPTLIGNHIAGVTPINYTDTTPVALLLSEHTVFSVRNDAQSKNVKELFDRLRADPTSMSIGIVAIGGPNHLALAQAAKLAGIEPRRLKTVVFKTNADSMTALAGGHIQLVASSINSARAQVKAGNARILAVASDQRMGGEFAFVPTLREQGIDARVASWRGVFGPKGMTRPQVAYWEDVLSRMVASPEWKAQLETHGWSGQFLKSAEFTKYLEADYAANKAVMADLGLVK